MALAALRSARSAPRFDVLRIPGLGRALRWKWGRLLFQIPLLFLVGLIIYDGFSGPKLASENIATVATWIHYRGLVVLALLLAGNLFCMGCPFVLPRTVARRLSECGRRWPRHLRHKWLAIALLFLIFWLYEWLDLWASPWLTAWVAVGYFAAALILEMAFAGSPFCKYLCPLGSFNFVGSTMSPLQITVHQAEICRTCAGKECVNGSSQALGCGTELFAPQVRSNWDCTLCLDCVRACPYDNVALAARSPLSELVPDAWPRRWDVGFLALVFVFASLGNAFGMVPPVYVLQATLSAWLPWLPQSLILLLMFATLDLVLPVLVGLGAAWVSRNLTRANEPLRLTFARGVPAFAPLGMAIWLAHYGFHFATGAAAIIPVFQNFLLDHGLAWLGAAPNWRLGPILPYAWLLPLQVFAVLVGLLASLYVLGERTRRAHPDAPSLVRALLPWTILLLALAFTAIYLFTLPMEMRGTVGFGN